MKTRFWYLEKETSDWSVRRPKTFVGIAVMLANFRSSCDIDDQNFEPNWVAYYSTWFNAPLNKEVFFYQNILDLE